MTALRTRQRSHARGSGIDLTTAQAGDAAVDCRGLTKAYGRQMALRCLDWSCNPGEIHGIVGQNGAGKSTLVGSITGRLVPDAGEVWIAGRRLPAGRPRASHRLGVAAVFQELGVIPALSALENVFLGHTPQRGGILVDRRAMRQRFAELAERFEVSIDPHAPVGGLPVGKQQVIEIMRCVSSGAAILLLDEPSAALSEAERGSLHRIIRELPGKGLTVLFISHNLDEVEALCDRLTVLAEGQLVGTRPTASWNRDELIMAIAGSTVSAAGSAGWGHDRRATEGLMAPPRAPALSGGVGDTSPGPPSPWALSVRRLSLPGGTLSVDDLTIRSGEILGLAGLMGSGRTRLLRCLGGLEPDASADMAVGGTPAPLPKTPRQALRNGVALLPEDRKNGLVLGRSMWDNMRLGATAVERSDAVTDEAMRMALERVGAPLTRMADPVGTLSGGNQQKVLLAKWLARGVRVLLVDEPTRGIDIGAKTQILTLLRDLTGEGLAVVFVSSELEEVLAVADRVAVMADGRATAELGRGDPRWTVHDVLRIAFEGSDGPDGSTRQ